VINQNAVQKEEPVLEPVPSLVKLDLACGDLKVKGFVGVDIVNTGECDVVHDLKIAPWPWDDNAVDEARCSHFLEHLKPQERITFMNELYRVLKPEAGCLFTTPLGFERMVQDPTHEWPPIVPASYLYFDKQWLEENKLGHYRELHGIACDFDVRPLEMGVTAEFALRNDEHKMFAARHYRNAATDLSVLLVKRKKKEKEP